MEDVDVRSRQRMVLEFLTAEGSSTIKIHERLRNMEGKNVMHVGSVVLNSGVKNCGEGAEAADQTRQ
jgi:hypothetical protein